MALIAVLVAGLHANGQAVPEGVHSDASGPSTICGIEASTALEFRSKVEVAGLKRGDGGPRFDLFSSEMADDGMVQWAFAKPSEPAYPTATCRHLYREASGDLMIGRQMRCDATREACDALFIEFQALDDRVRAQLGEAK